MKKILVLSLALLFCFGVFTAPAQPIGLTAGLEFGFMSLNTPDGIFPEDEDVDAVDTMYIEPSIAFESEIVDDFSLFARLGLPMYNLAGDEDLVLNMDLTVIGTYSLELSPDQTLALGLGINMWIPDLTGDGDTDLYFTIRPEAMFTQAIAGHGALYAGLRIPMWVNTVEDSDFDMGMDIIAGFNFDMGLGIQVGLVGGPDGYNHFPWAGSGAGLNFGLAGDDGEFALGLLQIMPSFYMEDLLLAYLGVYIPLMENGMDLYGMTIIPGVEVFIPGVDGLMAYAEFQISGLGSNIDDSVNVGLTLGVQFSF
ncbi:MAG: hypothetical protein FWC36_08485 [Spirochaetes bacterium]|nr:hypothetical protein [Spirochaetota bacterium]